MSDIIKLNFRIAWKVPVYIRIGNGFRETIGGPDVALDYLNHRWPEHESPEYRTAKQICHLALCNRASDDAARQAFVDAAARAKLLA